METPAAEEVTATPTEEAWDYIVVTQPAGASAELHQEQLQRMGDAGWEIMFIRELAIPFGDECWYYFKRKRRIVDDAGID
jgi:hypothetical protein